MKTWNQWVTLREAEEPKSYEVTCSRCGRRMGWSKKPNETGVCPRCYNTRDLALSPGAGNRPSVPKPHES